MWWQRWVCEEHPDKPMAHAGAPDSPVGCEAEHYGKCQRCGAWVVRRDLAAVLAHNSHETYPGRGSAEMNGGVICATCLRCGHRGTIRADALRRHGQSPNVTLAYLSRFVKCEACGSRAVKLERLTEKQARAFISAA
jgi:hypothetical protein